MYRICCRKKHNTKKEDLREGQNPDPVQKNQEPTISLGCPSICFRTFSQSTQCSTIIKQPLPHDISQLGIMPSLILEHKVIPFKPNSQESNTLQ